MPKPTKPRGNTDGETGPGTDAQLFGYIDVFVNEDELDDAPSVRENGAAWFPLDKVAENAITDVELDEDQKRDSTQVG